jgi:hypothetical protein
MNDTSTSNLVEHRWNEAVKNYVPRVLAKWKRLGCLQEGIREVRATFDLRRLRDSGLLCANFAPVIQETMETLP